MPHDPALADLMRADLTAGGGPGARLVEKRMFGGLCFMAGGYMVACISTRGALYRPGAAAEAQALALPDVTPMVHGGRRMTGYVWLDLAAFRSDPARRRLLGDLALAHVAGLPPKP